jgi:hypothetical protein
LGFEGGEHMIRMVFGYIIIDVTALARLSRLDHESEQRHAPGERVSKLEQPV